MDDKVTNRTTHLITLEPRRTINLLRGLIRGIWILKFDYIVESLKQEKWMSEEMFEEKNFSKSVQV